MTHMPYGLLLLTVVLLIVSGSLPSFGVVSFIALIPLFLFLSNVEKNKQKKVVLLIWLTGVVACGTNLFWLTEMTFNIGSSSLIQGISIMVWVLASFIFSLPFLIMGIAAVRSPLLFKKTWPAIVVLPAFWVLAEYMSSWLFSVIFAGSDGTVGAHWGLAHIGMGTIDTPLRLMSRVVGLYGLTFLVVAANVALFFALKRQRYRPLIITSLVIGLLWMVSFMIGTFHNNTVQVSVAATQIASNQTMESQRLDRSFQKYVTDKQVAVAVLPEYPFFFESNTEQKVDELVVSQAWRPTVIVYSKATADKSKRFTDIVWQTSTTTSASTTKYFLIPGGEYLPWFLPGLMRLVNQEQVLDTFRASKYVHRASSPETPFGIDSMILGSLSCAGVVSSEFYRRLADSSSTLLTNSASLEVFANSPQFFRQAERLIRFHATANAKPFVQSSRGGPAYIIDENGTINAKTNGNDYQAIGYSVRPSSIKTPFTRAGEYFVALSLLIICMYLLSQIRIRKS